jgi:o-succinylbenzoate synthase
MIVRGFIIEPYRLPLRAPWRSARGDREVRDGWLLRARTDHLEGFGDCAPLPAAGTEQPAEALAWLQRLRDEARGQPVATCLKRLDSLPCPPAARCAVETALLDLMARAGRLPLARLLDPDAVSAVAANASVGAADGGLIARCNAALDQGFRVLKVKAGMLPVAEELSFVRGVAALLPPGATLRLDPNRAWSEADARMALAALAELPVDSVEEPLARPSLAALAALQREVPFAIAIDESRNELGLERILAERPVRRLVLKPMLLGGPRATLDAARRARAAGLEWVITTTVDSAVGCWASVHVAAALPGGCAHGLATSEWMAQDVAAPPRPAAGRIALPDAPGLGLGPVVVPAVSFP